MKEVFVSPTLYLAPLHGVTNYVYRNAVSRHFTGIDAAMAPFVNSINSETAYAKGRGNHFKDLIAENNKGLHIIPQILSNDFKSFIETATSIKELGYSEVNWNLGCPFPMVTRKKRGSGLLPHPDIIEQFLSEICSKLDMHISVKVRLGLKEPTELTALMPIFNSFPLQKIIIHPRIGTQMYKGTVNIDGFSHAAKLSKHPVMYNGDITNAETFFSLQKRFPDITEWMIGR
ncbi:MAG TPA: tRNA-dihydrouridine synthase family protein, partial [Treponemataceae bacterium]|nr:tRNA-dihydrouridine synthase family protein [Treponemataceae bacterium]